ncbi:MAG: tRNA preQ1(34) S-adenosylmethionine ribosyltransferase-isomerase QueA [Gemmatimonadaceae bacterium]|nr:tRNA preQ1(34) S-adenosylmethionine ribosyltransferase-isomerase QueA [Gemmatimonadaceae bacterium]
MTANGSRTSDYDFELPPELIAQHPAARREDSRLMVVHRLTGEIEHHRFTDLPGLIAPNDCLVINTTKVFRARLLGKRGSGSPAEILLLRDLGHDRWEAMVSPGNKLKPGRVVEIASGFSAEIREVTERGTRIVQLSSLEPVADAIEQHGHIPLPPYIDRDDSAADVERYQTVYANQPGSVAAPTAGLHFTPEILREIKSRGAYVAKLTLHVGAGTFKPVDVEDPAGHVMHQEWYYMPDATASVINTARKTSGGKVWAVGTTSVRTLESVARDDGMVHASSGETRIFIRPPYTFRAVDRIITNFHLPRSTLIMLVAAFAGYELTMRAYQTAIREKYRFYSYGDAMAIVD